MGQPRHRGLGHAGLQRPPASRGALGRDQLRPSPRRRRARPEPRARRASQPAVAVAPDFTFTTGVGDARALKDWRGRGVVLLVFFTLPGLGRPSRGARTASPWRCGSAGARSWACPSADARDLYRALGGRPVFFPLAVEGAAEAGAAYSLFRRDLTAERATARAAARPAHGAARRPAGIPSRPLDPAGRHPGPRWLGGHRAPPGGDRPPGARGAGGADRRRARPLIRVSRPSRARRGA